MYSMIQEYSETDLLAPWKELPLVHNYHSTIGVRILSAHSQLPMPTFIFLHHRFCLGQQSAHVPSADSVVSDLPAMSPNCSIWMLTRSTVSHIAEFSAWRIEQFVALQLIGG